MVLGTAMLVKGLASLGSFVKDAAVEAVTRPFKDAFHGFKDDITGSFGEIGQFAIGTAKSVVRPDQALKIRLSSAFEQKLMSVREPILNVSEFKVEQIRGDDPLKSIDKIHANIVGYLNIVNKNTTQTFEYVRSSVKQQNVRVEDIKKSTAVIHKSYNDLSERITKLNIRVSDIERQKRTPGLGAPEEKLKSSDKDADLLSGLLGGLSGAATGAATGAAGGLLARALKGMMRGGGLISPIVAASILKDFNAADVNKDKRSEVRKILLPWMKMFGLSTDDKETAEDKAAPAPWERDEKGESQWSKEGDQRVINRIQSHEDAREKGVAGSAYRAFHPDTPHSFNERFGSWDKNERTGASIEKYELKKQSISMQSASDLKMSAQQSIELKARSIALKATDCISLDAPKIIFSTCPTIKSADGLQKLINQCMGRGEDDTIPENAKPTSGELPGKRTRMPGGRMGGGGLGGGGAGGAGMGGGGLSGGRVGMGLGGGTSGGGGGFAGGGGGGFGGAQQGSGATGSWGGIPDTSTSRDPNVPAFGSSYGQGRPFAGASGSGGAFGGRTGVYSTPGGAGMVYPSAGRRRGSTGGPPRTNTPNPPRVPLIEETYPGLGKGGTSDQPLLPPAQSRVEGDTEPLHQGDSRKGHTIQDIQEAVRGGNDTSDGDDNPYATNLQDSRKEWAEAMKDPEFARRVAAQVEAEVGGQGDRTKQAFLETVMNRSLARSDKEKLTPQQILDDKRYFPSTTLDKRNKQFSPQEMEEHQKLQRKVLSGSNVSDFATGNYSQDASKGYIGAPVGATNVTGLNRGKVTFVGNKGVVGGQNTEYIGQEGPDIGWEKRLGPARGPTKPTKPGQLTRTEDVDPSVYDRTKSPKYQANRDREQREGKTNLKGDGGDSDVDEYLYQKYLKAAADPKKSGANPEADKKAAAAAGMTVKEFVIGGMNKDFKTNLYFTGKELDKQGKDWAISTGFRDDYRQSLIEGAQTKAAVGHSQHGGSQATAGYGDGRAADIVGNPAGPHDTGDIRTAVEQLGGSTGVNYPYSRSYDRPHVGPTGLPEKSGRPSEYERKTGRKEPAGRYKSITDAQKQELQRRRDAEQAAKVAQPQANTSPTQTGEKFPGTIDLTTRNGQPTMDFERLGPTEKGKAVGTTSGPMEGPPKGIIFHHTEGTSVEGAIGGMNERRNAVQYIIGLDKDGNAQVYQTLPGGHKGAHISSAELPTTGPYSKQDGLGISNANTIGIELVGYEGNIDPKITAKAREFGLWLMKTNPNAVVLGHGDVNPRNREGKDISTWLRENAPAKAPKGQVISDASPDPVRAGQQYAGLTTTPKILTPQDIADMEKQRIGAAGGYANNAARPPPPFLPPGMTPRSGPQYNPPARLGVRSDYDPAVGLPSLTPGGKPVPVDTTQSLLRPAGSPDVGAPLDIRSDDQKGVGPPLDIRSDAQKAQDAPVHPNQPAMRTQADVNKHLADLASKRKKERLNWKGSVVDTMKLLGMDSSQKARIKLAKQLGYAGPNNSRSRNVWLQQKLRSKLMVPPVAAPYTGPDEGQGKGKRLDPNVPLEEQLGTRDIPPGPPLDITPDVQKTDTFDDRFGTPITDQLGINDIPGPSGRPHETVLGGTPFDAAGKQGAPGGPSGPPGNLANQLGANDILPLPRAVPTSQISPTETPQATPVETSAALPPKETPEVITKETPQEIPKATPVETTGVQQTTEEGVPVHLATDLANPQGLPPVMDEEVPRAPISTGARKRDRGDDPLINQEPLPTGIATPHEGVLKSQDRMTGQISGFDPYTGQPIYRNKIPPINTIDKIAAKKNDPMLPPPTPTTVRPTATALPPVSTVSPHIDQTKAAPALIEATRTKDIEVDRERKRADDEKKKTEESKDKERESKKEKDDDKVKQNKEKKDVKSEEKIVKPTHDPETERKGPGDSGYGSSRTAADSSADPVEMQE